MWSILHFLLGSIFNVLVNFEASVRDLLFSFISFDEDRPCLDDAITFPSLKEVSGTLITLINNSDLFMYIGLLQSSIVHIIEVVIYKIDTFGFDKVQIK